MSAQDSDSEKAEKTAVVSRRRALAKLGLAAGAAYIAPSVLRINRVHALPGFITPCPQADNNPANNPPARASCPP
jgi:hypothetical protein